MRSRAFGRCVLACDLGGSGTPGEWVVLSMSVKRDAGEVALCAMLFNRALFVVWMPRKPAP